MKRIDLILTILFFVPAATLGGCSRSEINTNTAANSRPQNMAANGQPQNTNVNAASPNTDAGVKGYPQQVADDFVQACEDEGTKSDLCKCVFEKIREKYAFEEFQVIASEIEAGQAPEDFLKFSDAASADCMKQAK